MIPARVRELLVALSGQTTRASYLLPDGRLTMFQVSQTKSEREATLTRISPSTRRTIVRFAHGLANEGAGKMTDQEDLRLAFKVVMLKNGRFFGPSNPNGVPQVRVAMNWPIISSEDKIRDDVKAVCEKYRIVVPELMEIRTIRCEMT